MVDQLGQNTSLTASDANSPDLPLFDRKSVMLNNRTEEKATVRAPQAAQVKIGAADRARIQKRYLMGVLPSMEEFRSAFPDATPERIQAFQQELVVKERQDKAARIDEEGRTAAEIIGDTDTAVGIGLARLGQLADTAVNLPATLASSAFPGLVKSPGETAFGTFLKDKLAELNSRKSEALQFSEQEQGRKLQEFKDDKDSRQEEYDDRYGSGTLGYFLASMEEGAREFGTGAATMLSDPRLLISTAIENAPQLLLGAGISAATKSLATAKSVEELVSSNAFKDRVEELGVKANVVFNGLSEGNEAALQIRDEVLNADLSQLIKENPEFAGLIEQLGSEEEARAYLANDAFILGLGAQSVIAAATAKFTGSSKADSQLLDAGKSKSSIVGAATKEAAEEAINEGTSQAVQNTGTKLYVDSEQSVSEDVASSAAIGAVAGPATQAGVTTAVAAAKPVTDTASVVETAKAVKTKAKQTVDSVKTAKAAEKIVKNKAGVVPEGTAPEVAAEVHADTVSKPEVEISQRLSSYVEFAQKINEVEEKGAASKEYLNSFKYQLKKSEQAIKAEVSKRALTDAELFEIAKVNPAFLDETKTKQLKESTSLSSQDKDLLGNQEELAKIETDLAKVQSDIFNGSREFKGIATYITELRSAVAKKNTQASQKAIDGLDNLRRLQEEKLVDLQRLQELVEKDSLTEAESAELDGIQAARNISFIGPGIRAKLIPAVKVEIDGLTSAVNIAKGISDSGIDTSVVTTLAEESIPDVEIVDTATDAGTIKDRFNTLSPRSRQRLEESLPNLYKSIANLDPARSLTDAQYRKITDALNAAEQTTDSKRLKKAIAASTNATELLENTRNFGDKKLRAVVDKLKDHPLLEGVSLATGKVPNGLVGTYSKSKRRITISSDILKNQDADNFDKLIETVVHEVVHPVTVDLLDADLAKSKGLTKQHLQFVKRIDALNRAVSKHIEKNHARLSKENPSGLSAFAYALNDIQEYPTKVLTDPAMQKLLKEVVINKKSVFTRLAETFANLFGLSKGETTALQEAISISEDIIDTSAAGATPTVTTDTGYSLAAHLKDNTVNDGEFAKRFKLDTKGTLGTTPYAMSALEEAGALQEFHDNFKKVMMEDTLKVDNPRYRDVRQSQYMLNAVADTDNAEASELMDDNVVAAVTLATLNWLKSSAIPGVINGDEDINRILGRTSDAVVSVDEYRKYAYVGSPTTLSADNIGADVVKALGITAQATTHPDDLAKMTTSIGLLAVETLDRMGMVTQSNVLLPEGTSYSEVRFVRVANQNNTVLPDVRALGTLPDTYQEQVATLVGSKELTKSALFSPVSRVPTRNSRNSADLSPDVRKALRKQMDESWEYKKETVNAFYSLSPDAQKRIAGWVHPSTVHIDRRESVEAKNASIERGMEDMIRMLIDSDTNGEQGQDTPFYFDYQVWVNGRIGMVANWINPQANKLHRALVGMTKHRTEVDPANTAQMKKFWIAVGVGFGIDKGTEDAIVGKVKAFAKHPDTVSAVNALRYLQSDSEPDTERRQAAESYVLRVVNGSPHAFESLAALANMSETEPFTTMIAKEIDGITNGPVIGLLQFMLSSPDNTLRLLEKGGIFSDGITTNYAEALNNGLEDLYDTLVAAWRSHIAAKPNAITMAMDALGLPMERNEGKDPLVKTIYGAGAGTLAKEFAENRLEAIIDKAIKIDTDSSLSLEEREAELTKINTIVNNAIGSEVLKFRAGTVLKTRLHDKTRARFVEPVAAAYRDSLVAALKDSIPDVIQGNDVSVVSTDLTYRIYKGIYGVEKAKLEAAGNWTVESKKALEAKLDLLAPGVANYHAKDKRQGILLKNTARAKPSVSVKVEGSYKGKNSLGTSTYKTTPSAIRELSAPGVSPASMYVQGIDASTMINIYTKEPVFGVHDAIIVGLNEEEKVSSQMNEGFFNIVRDYSIMEESLNSLRYALQTMRSYSDPEEQAAIRAELKGFTGHKKFQEESINGLLRKFSTLLATNTANRKEVMSRITYVNQYENADGGYEIEEKATQEAKKLQELIQGINTTLDSDELANPGLNEQVFNVDKDSVEAVFDALQTRNTTPEDSEHREYLKDVLSGLVSKVIEPLNVYVQDTFAGSTSYNAGGSIYLHTASSAIPNTGLKRSAEEHYTYEMVFNVIHESLHNNSQNKRALYKLFRDAQKASHITPEIFMSDPTLGKASPEYPAAKAMYDTVFANISKNTVTTTDPTTGLTATATRNDYLAHFAATALSNQKFKDALTRVKSTSDTSESPTLLERITAWFNTATDILLNRTRGISGTPDERVLILAKRLAGITHKRGGAVGTVLGMAEVLHERSATAIRSYVLKPLVDLVRTQAVLKAKSHTVKRLGLIAQSSPALVISEFVAVMRRVRRRSRLMREGFAAEFITELKGTTDNNEVFHTLQRVKNKTVDQLRIQTLHNIRKFVAEAYNVELTPEKKEAVYKVLMRTDMQSIADDYTTGELLELIRDNTYLTSEIIKATNELRQYSKQSANFYVKAALDLGHFMVHGTFEEAFRGMNAHVIANMYNTGVTPTWDTAAAQKTIDRLATLQALQLTDRKQKEIMHLLMDAETSADVDNNGITATLGMLKHFQEEASELLFQNQDALKIKGYTKDIYNPDITIEVATQEKGEELKKLGYEPVGEIKRDIDDPLYSVNPLVIYKSTAGLQGRYDAGVVSTTNKGTRGTTLEEAIHTHSVYPGSDDMKIVSDSVETKRQHRIKHMFNSGSSKITGEATLIPILNANGDVVEQRYMMSDRNREVLLERDNGFDEVLGGMFASTLDKVNSKVINRKAVEAMKADYDKNYAEDPNNFTRIALDSDSDRYREIYRMLPKDMQRDVREIWGDDALYVKHEHVTLLFGRRKPSVANLKYMPVNDETGIKRIAALTNNVATMLLNNKKVKRTEDVWKESVSLAKDAIVVKTGAVTVGNITSNFVSLKLMGVPAADIVSGHAEAYYAVLGHIRDARELEQLKLRRKFLSKGKSLQSIDAEIAIIEDRIAGNPAKELIDLGIFQNIIEDVNLEDDKYTYRSALKHAADPIANKIPDGMLKNGVSTGLKYLFITHDTAIYKFMRDTAQISDFAARFVLHKHNLAQGMSTQESIRDIVETFVNYDLPTHSAIQYGNEMGLLMFTKFTIRTQKVILKLLRKHPENVVLSLLLQSGLGDVTDIVGETNPFAIDYGYKINPIPFDLLESIIDIPTINLLQEEVL